MREGHVYKRCRKCSRTITKGQRRCANCGGDRYSWTFSVDVSRPGEPRRIVLKADPTWQEADARAAMNVLQASVRDGTNVEASRLTVAEYLNASWLPAIRGEVRGGTWVVYELSVRLHIAPAIGAVRLQSLTRARVKKLYADLEASGLSSKTTHNIHMVLRRALQDAMDDSLITRNPAAQAHKMASGTRREMKVWDATQTSAFLGSVASDRLVALWRLAATTGMRRGELLGLRWSDMDLEAGAVSIQRALVRGANGVEFGAPKTKAGLRSIPLDAATTEALRAHRRRQVAERLAYGPGWQDQDLVFCREDGLPLDRDGVSVSFERLSRLTGLPKIRLHDLRHGAASLLLAAGINPKVVQERLGHSSIQITMDLYSHVTPGIQADASDRLAALLDA